VVGSAGGHLSKPWAAALGYESSQEVISQIAPQGRVAMAVFFRALVMLVTLVGLPAAWVYCGPLPDGAQRVVDRFVEVAQDALGWKRPATVDSLDVQKAPARFNGILPTPPDRPQVSQASYEGPQPPAQLAGATSVNLAAPLSTPANATQGEMEMHLTLLKKMGAAQYALEKWGAGYRFKCAVALGDNPDFTRQFEAIDADPLATVRQVVGEVTSWQNARHDVPGSATVWR
jgi:hypothetical protein